MPHYRKHGKIQIPLSHTDFLQGMAEGLFFQPEHRGFTALIYYTGIRRKEALRSTREQFTVKGQEIFFDVLKRLKHGLHTPALNIPLEKEYAKEILACVEKARPGKRIWPYCDKTGYNIVARVFHYPHHLRLSRITNFFLEGHTIAEVRSWTGLSLKALEYYVGLVNIVKMGRSLS